MVTGGLGYMGLILSESLFASMDARLVLVGRSTLPDSDQWHERSTDPSFDEQERQILRRLAAMRDVRDDVLVLHADLRDEAQVGAAVDAACARFGAIDMVVHGAANVESSGVRNGCRNRTVGHRQSDLSKVVRVGAPDRGDARP